MVSPTEKGIGYGFGLLGGLLIALGAVVAFAVGTANAIIGHPMAAVSMLSESIVLLVVGALAVFFAYLGAHAWRDRPITSGVMLVVIALLGWGLLGLGSNVIALVGAILVFLAGILYLVEPTKRAVVSVASA